MPSSPPSSWQRALDELYGFVNWETKAAGARTVYRLDRVRAILAAQGDPQRAWPAVHVGGTNGKGSTCAMIASILRASGYRTGLYSSPHMHTVRERIQVDGRPIAEREVEAWLERRRELLAAHEGVTTFEVLTALAFEHFARREVDVAVVEVGLGGRLDTTRVVEPAVTVLTSIGLDHREVLGDTLRQIASDKVGILRPGVPAIAAPQEPEALAVIEAECERLGVPLALVGREAACEVVELDPHGQRLAIAVAGTAAGHAPARYDVRTVLLGPHQRVNATAAVAAADALRRAGWRIDRGSVARGMGAARWPGRFEILAAPGSPSEGAAFVVDGAHNPHAVAALVATLAEVFPDRRRTILIVGIGGEKDRGAMLASLLPHADRILTARADHPKAIPAEALAGEIRAAGREADPCASPASALAAARAEAGPGDVVLATGSIFLAADVREAAADLGWLELTERDPPTAERPIGPARRESPAGEQP